MYLFLSITGLNLGRNGRLGKNDGHFALERLFGAATVAQSNGITYFLLIKNYVNISIYVKMEDLNKLIQFFPCSWHFSPVVSDLHVSSLLENCHSGSLIRKRVHFWLVVAFEKIPFIVRQISLLSCWNSRFWYIIFLKYFPE